MTICLPLRRKKGEIFADLSKFCIPLEIPVPVDRPGPEPGPLAHLRSLATILALASTLPVQLKMRGELQNVASKALDAVVADLGDDVELYREGVGETPAYAK